jgi:hypothetical protein
VAERQEPQDLEFAWRQLRQWIGLRFKISRGEFFGNVVLDIRLAVGNTLDRARGFV